MGFIEWLREREEARRKLFEEYLRRLSEEPVTVILFGSGARGDHNLLKRLRPPNNLSREARAQTTRTWIKLKRSMLLSP